jgi:hypothetical protein
VGALLRPSGVYAPTRLGFDGKPPRAMHLAAIRTAAPAVFGNHARFPSDLLLIIFEKYWQFTLLYP